MSSGIGHILVNVPPTQRREFLRYYIQKRRKKKAQEDYSTINAKSFGYSNDFRRKILNSPLCDDEIKTPYATTGVKEHGQQLYDVKTQVSCLQTKLVSLKEEKHSLFRQLKAVLNEEDEKRDGDQKHSDPLFLSGDIAVSNNNFLKQTQAGPDLTATRQIQREPLLPTPESNQLARQNVLYYVHHNSQF